MSFSPDIPLSYSSYTLEDVETVRQSDSDPTVDEIRHESIINRGIQTLILIF